MRTHLVDKLRDFYTCTANARHDLFTCSILACKDQAGTLAKQGGGEGEGGELKIETL